MDEDLGGRVARNPKAMGKGNSSRNLSRLPRALDAARSATADLINGVPHAASKADADAIKALSGGYGLFKAVLDNFQAYVDGAAMCFGGAP